MEGVLLTFFMSLTTLIILMLIGVPVPFCFAAALLVLSYSNDIDVMAQLGASYYALSSLTLLAIPLFILVGTLMSSTRIADRIVAIANSFVGRFKGGLGAATVIASAMTGAIAGTCSAAAACVGTIMIPLMEKEGYPRAYSSGLIACSAILGQLIPPSIAMILYGFIAQVSVIACFLAGVGPALVLIVIFCVINRFTVRQYDLKPSLKLDAKTQFKQIGSSLYHGFFALLIPIVIFVGIYGGIMTTSESAAVAVVLILIIGFFIYRSLSLKVTFSTFATAGVTTGVILLMMFFVVAYSRVQVMLQVPQSLISSLAAVSDNKYVILLMVNVFLIILGMLIGDYASVLLATPLLLPLMSHLGIHPVHFAAIIATNCGLGNMSPPCAPILYLTARIGNVSIDKVLKPAFIYIIFGMLPVVLFTTYWPPLSLTIPTFVMPQIMR